jgi:hypothetical protein
LTFLQLINRVLVRLREKTVTTPTESEYSSLIGAYINDAKEHVEKTWDWKALRRELTFPTVSAQNDYNLGAGGVATGGTTTETSRLVYDNANRPQVFNLTEDGSQLSEAPLEYLRGFNASSPSPAMPGMFSLVRAGTGVTMRFVPAPDAVYAMKAVFVIPQDDLSAGSDVLTVPATPVWKIGASESYPRAWRGYGRGSRKTVYQKPRWPSRMRSWLTGKTPIS